MPLGTPPSNSRRAIGQSFPWSGTKESIERAGMDEPAEIPAKPPCDNRIVKKLMPKHTWTFRARFRRRALGWNASRLACQRLKGFRRIFSRFEKRDAVFLGFLNFALIVEALRIV